MASELTTAHIIAEERRTAEEYSIRAASARFKGDEDNAAHLERLAGMYLAQADRIKRLRLMVQAINACPCRRSRRG